MIWKQLRKTEIHSNVAVFGALSVLVVFTLTTLASNYKNQVKTPPETNQTVKKAEGTDNTAPENQLKVTEVSTSTPPQEAAVLVSRVIDGDTIEIEGGQTVRYIGIDTPETVHPTEPIGCFGKEASAKNTELVAGKRVQLGKDVSETDKYGRLLRYVWVGDVFVNDYLVRQGYAKASSYPPDVKYQDQFRLAEAEARDTGRGFWAPGACETANTLPPTTTSAGQYTCDCSRACDKMVSCEEAYFQLNSCGCSKRDGDKDGVPCEDICQ